MPASPAAQHFRFTAPDGLTLTGEIWPGGGEGGAETRPPLVFLPGNGFPVQAYRPVAAGHPHVGDVHALNPRGIGGSDVPAAFESWDVLLDDLRAYVQERFDGPVLLGGHSLGAILSLRLAAEHPGLALGLLMLEPVVRGGAEGEWDAPRLIAGRNIIERTRTRQAEWPTRAEAEAAFTGHPAYTGWHPDVLRAYLAHGLVAERGDGGPTRLATPPWLEALIYETEPKHALFGYARAARCPGVVLRGASSQDVNVAGLEELARTLPVGVLVAVPGSHVFPMERPGATAEAVRDALAILTGATDPYRNEPLLAEAREPADATAGSEE